MRHNGTMNAISRPTYDDVIAEISAYPGEYWLEQARTLIDWVKEPTRAVDDSTAPIYRWFPDGELNVCFNALDRHVAPAAATRPPLIYDSPSRTPSARSPTRSSSTRSRASPVPCPTAAWAKATASSSTCR